MEKIIKKDRCGGVVSQPGMADAEMFISYVALAINELEIMSIRLDEPCVSDADKNMKAQAEWLIDLKNKLNGLQIDFARKIDNYRFLAYQKPVVTEQLEDGQRGRC